jgi:DNA-directed RNA polymerase subunit M/transcription elongation factor TFIIS
MTATMNCPGCQATLRLRDDMAGKKIKCPRCAQLIKVPTPEGVTAEAAAPGGEITAEVAAKSEGEPAATRRCPACGERIAVTARQCRYCQADVEEAERAEAPAQRRSKYKPCPRCGEDGAKRVKFTFWGSYYGTALFTHVRCPGCGYKYNGRTGRSNIIPAVVFVTVPLLGILALIGWAVWYVHKLGYF